MTITDASLALFYLCLPHLLLLLHCFIACPVAAGPPLACVVTPCTSLSFPLLPSVPFSTLPVTAIYATTPVSLLFLVSLLVLL